MLLALSKRPCGTLGPVDFIDPDYIILKDTGLVEEYWGSGGVMCTVTEKAKAIVERP